MTRVNVGIMPEELCDQMLLAELRELPRCFAFKSPGPEKDTLGTGHVLWCAQYRGSLFKRFNALYTEALVTRNFKVSYRPANLLIALGGKWSAEDETYARPLLIKRINLRLTQMKRIPKWTNRRAPYWGELNHK